MINVRCMFFMTSVTLFTVFTSGCATLGAPSSALIDQKPVIKIGETHRDSAIPEDHIVYLPAGVNFPMKFTANGNIFLQNGSATVIVSLNHDLYLYRQWASLDGSSWIHSHKLFNVNPSGGFDRDGGKMQISIDYSK
ncbi:MAG: hypothetical protein COC05_00015 [Gammaproteobacteria bacterium]|nr:MAG: hypothetical protein COC05_00015 [Gammaproteobacteria bacterium]